ncbi:MAG: GWxTD domain-containing protein [candidate division KSB1 bacterium]|nr:GWxTD domain-containing protein [candidate division KSB1 bacterium]
MILAWSSFAADKPPAFRINLDVAQFRDVANKTYLELYYSIPEAAVVYKQKSDSSFHCEILTSVRIYLADSLWASKLWKIEQPRNISEQSGTQQLVDLIRYSIDHAGQYKIILYARDLNQPAHDDSVMLTTNLDVFGSDRLQISDLELASRIERSNHASATPFAKHTYEVVPHPAGIYGQAAPHLFYYYEAYNLMSNVPGPKYKTLCQIKERRGAIVPNVVRPFQTKMKRYDASVEFGKIDISQMRSGIYTLVYGICDSAENILISKDKEFYIYNPAIDRAELPAAGQIATGQPSDALMSILSAMNSVELDQEFDQMYFLTNKNQRNLYQNLTDVAAKRDLIQSIWKASPPQPEMSALAFRQLYLDRINEADHKFGDRFRSGWRSDMGRIYVLYGPPSNIEYHTSSSATKPYQIWHYEQLEGGVYFVFIDRRGLNRYELIHSTLRGELQEPNWLRLITSGPNEMR